MNDLINWRPKENKFIHNRPYTKKEFRAVLSIKKRPKEIEELVEALTDFWVHAGAMKNCGKCFNGEFSRPKGCCGSCPNLGENGCVGKPIGCAVYTCGTPHFNGFPEWKKGYYEGFASFIQKFVWGTGLARSGYFSNGYLLECERQWTEEELKNAVLLTNIVRGY